MTSTPELLPCPFCGGKAQISRAHQNKMLAMGEVATDEHYLFTLHHTCNPALNDGVTVCWTYKPKAVLVAAWNRRAPTPPTDDEREVLARAIAPLVYATVTGNDDCREWEEMPEYVQDIYFQAADAALSALAPHIAAEIAAAVAKDRAGIVTWLREADNHIDGQFGYCERCHAADAIERGDDRSKP